MANPRKLPNGRWQVRFPAPDRHRESFDTKKEADAALAKARNARNEGTYIAPKSIPTFREAAEEWIAGKHKKRPATLSGWRAHLDLHLLPALGDLRLDRIDTAVIERFRDKLRLPPLESTPVRTTPEEAGDKPKKKQKRRQALSAVTANKVLTTAGAIFKMAVRRGFCLNNPVAIAERADIGSRELLEGTDQPRGEGSAEVRPDEILSLPEIQRLLSAADPGFHRTLIMTAAMTGMRHDELLALQWVDVEMDARKIYVRRSLSWARVRDPEDDSPARPRFYEPKTKAGRRTIPIASELVSVLKAWRLHCPKGDLDLVFPAPSGAPAHRSNILRRGLYPALRRAKLRRVDMHSLRHSFASILIASGTPVTEVQTLLGHSSPQTTLKVYAHWFQGVETTSVENLAKALLGTAGHLLDTSAPQPERVVVNDEGTSFVSADNLAPPGRFELPTPGLGILCSIHLS